MPPAWSKPKYRIRVLSRKAAMDELLAKELELLFAALGKTAEFNLHKTPPQVYKSNKGVLLHQDFRGGRSDADIENDIQLVIHNIGSLFDYLRAWARAGG